MTVIDIDRRKLRTHEARRLNAKVRTREVRTITKGEIPIINIAADIETSYLGVEIKDGVKREWTKNGIIESKTTEADRNDVRARAYACGCMIVGRPETYRLFNGIETCTDEMMRYWYELSNGKGVNRVFFHNMRFDVSVLAEKLVNGDKAESSKIIATSNRIYKWPIRMRNEEGDVPKRIDILDSYNRLTGSLNALGESCGYERAENKGDFNHEIYRERLAPDEEHYLEDDVKELAHVVETLIPDAMTNSRNFSITSASRSFKEIEARFNMERKRKGLDGELKDLLCVEANERMYNLIDENNTGGLIFTRPKKKYFTKYGVRSKLCCSVDIHSLYPSIVVQEKLPCGEIKKTVKNPSEEFINSLGDDVYFTVVGRLEGVIDENTTSILSDVNSKEPHRKGYNTRIKTVDYDAFKEDFLMQEPEFKRHLETGLTVHVSEINIYDVMPKEFGEIFAGMYAERRKLIKEKPRGYKARSFFLKIYLNAPLGKTAQKAIDEEYTVAIEDDMLKIVLDKEIEREYKSNMLLFAAITAYGRVRLARSIDFIQNVLGIDVLYGDTDSIYMACDKDEFLKRYAKFGHLDIDGIVEVSTEDELGKFSFEIEKGSNFCMVSAKCYSLYLDDGSLKCVMAGFSKDYPLDLNNGQQTITIRKMRNCRGGMYMSHETLTSPDFYITKNDNPDYAILPAEDMR